MQYYPIHVNLQHKQVAIIGGGKVAQRKINSLLQTNADILVVSPEVTETIKQWSEERKLEWRKKNFSPSDLDQATLVFAVTNDAKMNDFIKKVAKEHQWVNVSSNGSESQFHVPAMIVEGPLCITVSTSGISPSMSKKIGQNIKNQMDKQIVDDLYFLKRWRETIQETIANDEKRHALLRYFASESLLKHPYREDEAHKAYCQVLKDGTCDETI